MDRDEIRRILKEIPAAVTVVAAVKGRSPEEIAGAAGAGITAAGENYVQETEDIRRLVTADIQWHMIGHLQTNKVRKAVELYDMIQTVDSLKIAEKIDRECAVQKKVMPVLIEVNCAREPQKSGVRPEDIGALTERLLTMGHIRLQGLMTMGPQVEKERELRSYFREMRMLFDALREKYKDGLCEWKYLSMGMSSSYRIAIDEGATMIRLGTALFGPRAGKGV